MTEDRETGLHCRPTAALLHTYLADRGWPEIPGRPALQTPEKFSSDSQKFHALSACARADGRKIEPNCPLYRLPTSGFLRRSLPEDGVDSELGWINGGGGWGAMP